eukprot:s1929_g14.t1
MGITEESRKRNAATLTRTDESPVFSDATVDIAWPSAGSKFHGRGLCKPCAWLWKPQGCLNGTACLHCHLCPKSEVKSRKKLRAKARKARVPGVPASVEDAGSLSAPGLAPSVLPLSIPPPPGLPPPGLSLPLPRIESQPYPDSDPLEELESLEAQAAPAPPMPFQAEQEAKDGREEGDKREKEFLECNTPQCDLKGCANGADCLHCHLCTAGEARRKKRIAAKMRANGSESQTLLTLTSARQRTSSSSFSRKRWVVSTSRSEHGNAELFASLRPRVGDPLRRAYEARQGPSE